jgi:ADP-ribose pyrophosphatase YjhB (NUDIX family)
MERFKFCPKCGGRLLSKLVRSHERLVCEACGFIFFQNPKPTVGIFVFDQGKILLARRAIEPFKGWWDTIGGFIELGESPQEAAKREAKEETGLDIEIVKIFGMGKDRYLDEDIVPIALIGEIKGGEPQAADDISELAWFSLDKLPEKIAFESNIKALNAFKKALKDEKRTF